VIGIERIAVHVAAPDAFGRELFALLMTRCATGQNVVQRRVRIAAPADRNYVVDRDRDGYLSFVQAVLTEWVLPQLHAAVALPALRAIWPLRHPGHPIKLATSITGVGRAAMPIAMQVATIGSMRPVDLRLLNFRFPALSISTRQLAAAIFNTG
jgi:hypothetical protein